MHASAVIGVLGTVIALPFLAAQEPPVLKRTALVSLEARIEIKAPRERVWDALTSASGFCALTGFKTTEGARRLAKVGDAAAASIWDDHGMLVATLATANQELRVTFEPDHARYLCHKRITLDAAGAGTRVTVLDRYSDDQLDSVDQTAKQVAGEMPKTMAAFRALFEKQ
ncbi:MAG: SRPBCC domain-containing protein [Planctomycetota bacterium]